MPRDHQEMLEIDRNEYIFGEEGGRGTPASTFFRRIANMAPSKPRSYDNAIPDGQQVTIGAGRSHAERLAASEEAAAAHKHSRKSKSKKKPTPDTISPYRRGSAPLTQNRNSSVVSMASSDQSSYFDLDDDWDTNFDTVAPQPVARSLSSSTFSKSATPDRPEPSEVAAKAERDELNSQVSRILKFQAILDSKTVDTSQLRNIAWSGVPADLRPRIWMHMLGYLPSTAERRPRTLQKKREDYLSSINQVFQSPASMDQAMWHQIKIDIPRTNPHIKLYSFEASQRALERILYLWAIRHPASGYVQGINDLVTPFFQTFLTEYVGTRRVEDLDPGTLPKEQLNIVEADSYWCLSRLLDGIQDNYIHAQPGIHRQVDLLEKLVTKIDADLVKHMKSEGIEFMQFSFRWMNCLLMREIPMNCAIRIWDTYLAEGPQGFSDFHVYVCAAFLMKWAAELKHKDFQDLMIFLQALPTASWTEKDIELVLSAAFMYQSLYKDVMK